jgi:hypothetical protein
MQDLVANSMLQKTVMPKDAAVVQAQAKPAALGGLQQLRVLDLSVAGPEKGSMIGTLPDTFATLGQLQVSYGGAQPHQTPSSGWRCCLKLCGVCRCVDHRPLSYIGLQLFGYWSLHIYMVLTV